MNSIARIWLCSVQSALVATTAIGSQKSSLLPSPCHSRVRMVSAAALSSEVFKIASTCSPYMQNYMMFNDVDGVYTYTFEAERRARTHTHTHVHTALWTFTTLIHIISVYVHRSNQNAYQLDTHTHIQTHTLAHTQACTRTQSTTHIQHFLRICIIFLHRSRQKSQKDLRLGEI